MFNSLVAAWMFLLGCWLKSDNETTDNEYKGEKNNATKRKKQARNSACTKKRAIHIRKRRRKIREKTIRTVHKIRTGRRF